MHEQERWADVLGYEGLYRVSSLGRVVRLPRRVVVQRPSGPAVYEYGQRECTVSRFTNGRRRVHLSRDGGHKTHHLAVVMLESFVGPRPPGYHACHNDGDIENNRLENLRWDTPSANNRDKIRHGTIARGETSGMSVLDNNKVREIRKAAAEGEPQNSIARRLGVGQSTVSNVVLRRTWAHVT